MIGDIYDRLRCPKRRNHFPSLLYPPPLLSFLQGCILYHLLFREGKKQTACSSLTHFMQMHTHARKQSECFGLFFLFFSKECHPNLCLLKWHKTQHWRKRHRRHRFAVSALMQARRSAEVLLNTAPGPQLRVHINSNARRNDGHANTRARARGAHSHP